MLKLDYMPAQSEADIGTDYEFFVNRLYTDEVYGFEVIAIAVNGKDRVTIDVWSPEISNPKREALCFSALEGTDKDHVQYIVTMITRRRGIKKYRIFNGAEMREVYAD